MSEKRIGVAETPKIEKPRLSSRKRVVLMAVLAPSLTLGALGLLTSTNGSSGGRNNEYNSYSIQDANPSDLLADFPEAKNKITPMSCRGCAGLADPVYAAQLRDESSLGQGGEIKSSAFTQENGKSEIKPPQVGDGGLMGTKVLSMGVASEISPRVS